ncbi:hypothetical protein Salat_2727000 [Sesamum alatum]|uniref:Uncharacterized protein n=1 Tax=Sesamum alatum TaxID=300844 RepID=A0AAE1XJJ5_9LAMI|nr:hypothetical protein Salat_2727000 [Sesamum alatum]
MFANLTDIWIFIVACFQEERNVHIIIPDLHKRTALEGPLLEPKLEFALTQSPDPVSVTIPLLSFTLDLIFSPTPSNKIAASTTAATSAASTAAYAASVVSSVASTFPPQEIFSLINQISSSRTKAAAATDAYAASVDFGQLLKSERCN